MNLENQYRLRQFGSKFWMIEDLKVDPKDFGIIPESNTIVNPINNKWYYTWVDAIKISKEIGNGWHLPSIEEWNQLALDLGGKATKESDPSLVDFNFNHNIIVALKVNLSGSYYDGVYYYPKDGSYFWTSNESIEDSNLAFYRSISISERTRLNSNCNFKFFGYSVRLVKDV